MDYSIKEKEIAYKSVLDSKSPWFTVEDIKNNLEEEGFIIDEKLCCQLGQLIFTKDKTIKIISINKELSENKARKLLLTYYSYYKLEETEGYGFIRIFDTKKISNKCKRFGKLIQDYSVEKEFDYKNFVKEKELQKEKVIK